MGIIYKHTLLADCEYKNGSYIGQTCQDAEKRGLNGKGYLNNIFFTNIINKYGGDAFSHEILENNIETLEEANKREQYGIAEYHTGVKDPECHGFNLTAGGDANMMSRKGFVDKEGNFILGYKGWEDSLSDYRVLTEEEYKILYAQKSKVYIEAHKEQIKNRQQKGNETNAEKLKQQRHEYYIENKELIKEKRADYFKEYSKEYNKNMTDEQREKKNALNRQYRLANKEKLNEKARLRYERDKEKIKAKRKEYYEKNKDAIREKHNKASRDYYQKHKEEVKAKHKQYYETHKELYK